MPVAAWPRQLAQPPTLRAVRGSQRASLRLVSSAQRLSLHPAPGSKLRLLPHEPLGELPASLRPFSPARQPLRIIARSARLTLRKVLALDKLLVASSLLSTSRRPRGGYIGAECSFQRRLGSPTAQEGRLGRENPTVRQHRGHHQAAALRLDDAAEFGEHVVGVLPCSPARRDRPVQGGARRARQSPLERRGSQIVLGALRARAEPGPVPIPQEAPGLSFRATHAHDPRPVCGVNRNVRAVCPREA